MIETISVNTTLTLTPKFYEFYGKSLENYNVDVLTIVNLWKDLNNKLEICDGKNLERELIKMLNSLLSRINIHSQRMPLSMKQQSLKQLNESKSLIINGLQKYLSSSDQAIEKKLYLDCLFTCGLVYIINYRYSLNLNHSEDEALNQSSLNSLQDLNDYLKAVNVELKLNEKLDKEIKGFTHFDVLFYMVLFNIIPLIYIIIFYFISYLRTNFNS